MRISRPIPALNGGVSQLPQPVRYLNQVDMQVNGLASLRYGQTKRNPTEYLALLDDGDFGNVFIHTINRDLNERYIVVIGGNSIRVFDLKDYSEKTVRIIDGSAYLNSSNPREHFRAVTVNDYTFIVNRNVTPKMLEDLAPGTIKGSRQVFEELPHPDNEDDPPVYDGDLYEIMGDPNTNFDNYYVLRKDGAWTETVRPGIPYKIDAATMPHELVRMGDGTFEFRQAVWDNREKGDEGSNPEPSFIGNKINDVFWYQNRLCFLSDENVIMSGTSAPWNFWRTTVLDYLPSDRIDASVSSTRVSKLLYAEPFNKSIALLAEQDQFVLSSTGTTEGAGVAIDRATSIEIDRRCRPTSVGPDLYFAAPTGRFSAIHQLYVADDSVSTDTSDVTQMTPKYLPKNLVKLVSAKSLMKLFALSDEPGYRNRVYVHEFAYSGEERIQNAWHYWEFKADDVIKNIDVVDDRLYLIVYNPTRGTYLTSIDLEEEAVAPGSTIQLYLDDRVRIADATYDSLADKTTINLPYAPDREAFRVTEEDGRLLGPDLYEWINERTVRIPGNHPSVIIGHEYEHRFRFNEVFVRDNNDLAIQSGRLILQFMSVDYTDTAYFKVRVSAHGRAPQENEITPAHFATYTGKILGSDSFTLDAPSFNSGTYRFMVGADSREVTIEVSNTSHLAAKITSATWEGLFHVNARV